MNNSFVIHFFGKIPISTIYPIIEKTVTFIKTKKKKKKKQEIYYTISSKQNIKEMLTLFRFLNFRNLTDEKFNRSYELFERDDDNEKKNYIDYFHFDLE